MKGQLGDNFCVCLGFEAVTFVCQKLFDILKKTII